MDIEFHYYMTYLIAARAGFAPSEAATIAQAAQEIDDNHIPVAVSAGTPAAYENVISQTMNILHPHHNQKIYPIFHFIPGVADAPTAERKDGCTNNWVTTPNSPLANAMLDAALKSGDLYRIGASTHAFADTWAHQNFVGKDDSYNELPGVPVMDRLEGKIGLLRIGHALAGHTPDIPGLIWTDGRLTKPEIDNTARFLDAARALFAKLYVQRNGGTGSDKIAAIAESLASDLRADIGPSTRNSRQGDEARVERYKHRALSPPYGATPISEYAMGRWADEAFNEQHAGIATEIAEFIGRHAGLAGDMLEFGTRMPFTWKDPAHFRETNWYKFQEAVKAHLTQCWTLLKGRFPELAD